MLISLIQQIVTSSVSKECRAATDSTAVLARV